MCHKLVMPLCRLQQFVPTTSVTDTWASALLGYIMKLVLARWQTAVSMAMEQGSSDARNLNMYNIVHISELLKYGKELSGKTNEVKEDWRRWRNE